MTVTCPKCGQESPSFKGYAIHHSRSGHAGIPLVDLIGQERLIELYWSMSYEEIAEELGVGSTTVVNAYDALGVPDKTETNRLEYKYGVPLPWLLNTLHNTLKKSVNQMSEELGISRIWIDRRMYEFDIPKRGRSEAERLKWEQMTDEEREKQVAAAHKAARNHYAEFRTTVRGYEEWRDAVGGRTQVKHHRLLATLLVDDISQLDGMHVHHENGVPWDNRLENIIVITPDEHHQLHGNERRDSETGRFV